jgi:hypothetical protein
MLTDTYKTLVANGIQHPDALAACRGSRLNRLIADGIEVMDAYWQIQSEPHQVPGDLPMSEDSAMRDAQTAAARGSQTPEASPSVAADMGNALRKEFDEKIASHVRLIRPPVKLYEFGEDEQAALVASMNESKTGKDADKVVNATLSHQAGQARNGRDIDLARDWRGHALGMTAYTAALSNAVRDSQDGATERLNQWISGLSRLTSDDFNEQTMADYESRKRQYTKAYCQAFAYELNRNNDPESGDIFGLLVHGANYATWRHQEENDHDARRRQDAVDGTGGDIDAETGDNAVDLFGFDISDAKLLLNLLDHGKERMAKALRPHAGMPFDAGAACSCVRNMPGRRLAAESRSRIEIYQ